MTRVFKWYVIESSCLFGLHTLMLLWRKCGESFLFGYESHHNSTQVGSSAQSHLCLFSWLVRARKILSFALAEIHKKETKGIEKDHIKLQNMAIKDS